MTRLWPVTEEDLIRRAIEKRERWRWRFFWAGFVLFVLAMLGWAWLLVAGKIFAAGKTRPQTVYSEARQVRGARVLCDREGVGRRYRVHGVCGRPFSGVA